MENQDLLDKTTKRKKESLLQQLQPTQMSKEAVSRRLNISRPLSFSKRSLNISRQSFASEIPESEIGRLPSINTFLNSLAYLSIASLVYAALALYILNAFLDVQNSLVSTIDAIGHGNTSLRQQHHHHHHQLQQQRGGEGSFSSNLKLCKAGIALTSYVLAACFCCFMISAMQNVFASKIMKMLEGEERVLKYLEDCSSSRVLAIAGFFLCIPVSFIDLAIFLSLRSPDGTNLVGVVLLVLGAVLCLLGGAQSCYHWREEKIRAQSGMPVYDSRFSVPTNLSSYATPTQNLV